MPSYTVSLPSHLSDGGWERGVVKARCPYPSSPTETAHELDGVFYRVPQIAVHEGGGRNAKSCWKTTGKKSSALHLLCAVRRETCLLSLCLRGISVQSTAPLLQNTEVSLFLCLARVCTSIKEEQHTFYDAYMPYGGPFVDLFRLPRCFKRC